jgi:hypothetical protein
LGQEYVVVNNLPAPIFLPANRPQKHVVLNHAGFPAIPEKEAVEAGLLFGGTGIANNPGMPWAFSCARLPL